MGGLVEQGEGGEEGEGEARSGSLQLKRRSPKNAAGGEEVGGGEGAAMAAEARAGIAGNVYERGKFQHFLKPG